MVERQAIDVDRAQHERRVWDSMMFSENIYLYVYINVKWNSNSVLVCTIFMNNMKEMPQKKRRGGNYRKGVFNLKGHIN